MLYPTLVHNYLSCTARLYPDKAALIADEKRLSYNKLNCHSDRLANFLKKLGIKRQDRIIIYLDNSIESVISIYGILKASCIFVVLYNAIKPRQLKYYIDDSGAALLITHVDKANDAKDALDGNEEGHKIIWVGNSEKIPKKLSSISYEWDAIFSGYEHKGKNSFLSSVSENNIPIIDMDLAGIIYTSGSTGKPKGVMSPHLNMKAAAQSVITYLGNTDHDIILNTLPLSFSYGLYQILMSVMFGGTVVLEKNFLYPHKVLKLIETERVTGIPIVPTIVAMLLQMNNINKYDFSSLRYITNAGAALPVEHIKRFRVLFPHVNIYSMYGLTECKRVSYLHPEELDKRPSSVGKAMPNCEVFILNKDGKYAAPGEVGELVVRGSNVMQGYWNDHELTSKTFRPGKLLGDIWLYTGDYFRKDEEDFLYFVSRKNDIIKIKGERVSPLEIESLICEIEDVIEVAVVDVPDYISGQAIKVYAVLNKECKLTKNDILKYCAQNLESYKLPKYIEFINELPKTSSGKINKTVLKEIG